MLRWMAIGAAVLAGTTPAAAAPLEVTSWGKAGVTFDRYREDAVGCAIAAHNADISKEDATIRYRQGFEALERENNMPPMEGRDMDDPWVRAQRQVLLRRMYDPTRKVDQLQAVMTDKVSACLIDKGYQRFALTGDQRRRLNRLAPGTDARRRYLHELGSDPAVLARQARG